MEIHDIYEIKIDNILHFVYEGTCDGTPTKWITKTEWDFKITIQFINNNIKYTDSYGNEMLVFDKDDIEYKYI